MKFEDRRVPHGSGEFAGRFSGVAEAFAANFDDGHELGASFAVMADGEMIADLRGGYADKAKETPWAEDTLACVYSTGKAVLTLLIAREVGNGRVDYEAPVADYWPEFAQNGKQDVTVAQLLSHQAGLCAFMEETPPEIWIDWSAVVERLEGMAPLWPPGSACGYHAQTFGFLAGELLRRVSGESVGEMLRALAHARGFQVFCGLKPEEMERAAFMPKPPRAPDLGELNAFKRAAFLKPWSAAGAVSRERWMAAEIPASNMHADARSLARLLHPLANDGRWPVGDAFSTPDAVGAALKERINGDDLVLPFRLSWSAGLMRNINRHFGPNEIAFGHAGFGGSCIMIDPENRLTAAYVMNKMSYHLVGDPRALRLINALYDGLSN